MLSKLFLILFALVSMLIIGNRAHALIALAAAENNAHSDSLVYPYPEELDLPRELYRYYRWPELGALTTDSLDRQIELVLQRCHESRDMTFAGIELFTVHEFRPTHFRSTYRLCYLVAPDMMLGGGPPITAMIALEGSSRSIVVLDSLACGKEAGGNSLYDASGRPMAPDISTAVGYLKKDFKDDGAWRKDACSVSIEAVRLSAFNCPFLVLDDVYDIYEFSNAVASERFWSWFATADRETLTSLLTSVSLTKVQDNDLFKNNYEIITFPKRDFAKYAHVVNPASSSENADGSVSTSFFTWSPLNGALIQWKVTLGGPNRIEIVQSVLAYELGFRFKYL